VACAALAAVLIWRMVRARIVVGAGPWPGLTPSGAALLLLHALLLFGLLTALVGEDPRGHRAVPDLPILVGASVVPLAIAARLTRMPGAVAGVTGAYLLPRTLLTLAVASLPPPSLLLIPAMAFELALWLRWSDAANVIHAWPRRKRWWTKRRTTPRVMTPLRVALAGGVYGAVTAVVEPPFAILLGAPPAAFDDPPFAAVLAVSAAIGSILSLACGVLPPRQNWR
jgi:hypothetical protein